MPIPYFSFWSFSLWSIVIINDINWNLLPPVVEAAWCSSNCQWSSHLMHFHLYWQLHCLLLFHFFVILWQKMNFKSSDGSVAGRCKIYQYLPLPPSEMINFIIWILNPKFVRYEDTSPLSLTTERWCLFAKINISSLIFKIHRSYFWIVKIAQNLN